MPKEGISVYFTIKDGASSVLSSIGDKTKSLDKETQSLSQAYAALEAANKPLIQRQTELKKALEQSKDEIKEATKAYRELGDEASELKMTEAIESQETMKRELKDVESQIKSNQSSFNSYREDLRKGSIGSGGSSLISSLGQAGLWNALGDTASELGSMFVSSAFGSEGSTMFSSILGSAGTGAAIGSMILPGIGTAVGAALGGITGALTGQAEIEQNKDQAFIEYYNGLYDTVTSDTSDRITSGSSIAGGRETDLISFSTLLGDKGTASDFLANLVDMSNSTPFLYDDLTAMSKTLATYGFKDKLGEGEDGFEILDTLQKVGDAGAALGMETSDMTSVATALGRMLSSDKATLEYLNILNERGIGAISMLADARGQSVGDTYTDISKGNISGTEAVQIILAGMEDQFSGSMEAQSKTFEGLSSTVEGLQQEIENAAGEGYNEERNEGLQAEIDSLGGELGDAMQEVNSIMGKNQAYLENLSEQYQRDALAAVLLGQNSDLFNDEQTKQLKDLNAQYEEAKSIYEASGETDQEAALKMQDIYQTTEGLATAYYESSDQYQQKQDSEIDLLTAIRDNTNGLTAALNSYQLAVEQSKGGWSTYHTYGSYSSGGGRTSSLDNYVDDGGNVHSTSQSSKNGWYDDGGNWHSYAYGLDRVPYDDYPALLHAGERVLTAQEARAQDAQAGQASIQITVSGNSFTGTGEEMADQLAEIIARRLEQASVAAAPR
jgi:tape measure domain-containing protein